MRIFALAGVALATALAATPAAAVVEGFASFSPVNSTRNLNWVGSGTSATFYSTASGSANTVGDAPVRFNYLQQPFGDLAGQINANFRLQGTVTTTVAVVNGTSIAQNNVNGSFSFLSTSAFTVGSVTYGVGTNLLSGTFASAQVSGNRNATSGGFSASTPGSTITYTSDVLQFVQGSNFDLALSLTSITPGLNATPTGGTPTAALRSFRALVGGQFSSDPLPITPAIPEPAVWAQLIAGFALVGLAARRRKATVAA